MSQLTPRFQDAFTYAFELHADQVRKSSEVPYISHLMSAAALVMEDGGSEDEAIAALLHDAVEDQGGLAVLDEIRRRFGAQVAEIVDGCSDSYTMPKPPWQARKEQYIEHMYTASPGVRRVSLADKVHNARTIVASLRQHGDQQTWQRFKGGKEGTLWYYQTLVKVFRQTGGGFLTDELARTVDEMSRLAANRLAGE